MKDREAPRRIVEFERLNLLGKAVYTGGWIAHFAATNILHVVDRSAATLADAERAFRQGLDRRFDDAKIIEEHEEPRRREGNSK